MSDCEVKENIETFEFFAYGMFVYVFPVKQVRVIVTMVRVQNVYRSSNHCLGNSLYAVT